MTHTNDHDFQQFRGAFDDAMVPDAAFKAKMEKLLQSEKPVEPARTSTMLASPAKKQSEMIAPRRSHPLMVAVAILMVFSVVIASVWVLSGDVLEGEYASAPSGVATMPAYAPGMPGPNVEMTVERFMDWSVGDHLLGIYDDILLINGRGDGLSAELAAYDARSGQLLWSKTYTDFSGFGVGDYDSATGILVGYSYTWDQTAPYEVTGSWLTAMDVTSGEILWQHETGYDHKFEQHGRITTPTIAGRNAVLVDHTGAVQAWDIETGDPGWESTVNVGTGWVNRYINDDGTEEDVTVHTIVTTVWNQQLVVANGDGLMTVIDPSTGEIVAENKVKSNPGGIASPYSLEIDTFEGGVLMIREIHESDGPKGEIVAFNPETGEQLWQREIKGQLQTSSTEGGAIAVNSHIWKSYNWFMQLLRNYGHSTFQFHWIDSTTGDDILSTERGKLEAPVVTLTDGTYGCTRTEQTKIVCFDRLGTRHIVEIESWGDPMLVDGVMYIPTEDGLMKVQLP